MDFQMHTKEQVYELVEKAFKLGIMPDELWIAISRLTNVLENEKLRLKRIKEDQDKFKKGVSADPENNYPPYGEDE